MVDAFAAVKSVIETTEASSKMFVSLYSHKLQSAKEKAVKRSSNLQFPCPAICSRIRFRYFWRGINASKICNTVFNEYLTVQVLGSITYRHCYFLQLCDNGKHSWTGFVALIDIVMKSLVLPCSPIVDIRVMNDFPVEQWVSRNHERKVRQTLSNVQLSVETKLL